MSNTVTVSGHTSVISEDIYPPIPLNKGKRYGLGLIGFYSYNSVFNVDETNNCFIYTMKHGSTPTRIRIKPGAYEIEEIYRALLKMMKINKEDDAEKILALKANNNTLKCEISSKYEINFAEGGTIGRLLGFEAVVLTPNKIHESTLPVDIMKVRMVRIDCNITSGAYLNGDESHTLYEFDIDVEPGYKITREPANIIYLPVIPEGRQFIDNITLRILDDDGNLINFQGEKIIIKLELKQFT